MSAEMIFILSGPSGVGKGTIIKKVLERDRSIHLAVSCTTRGCKEGEVDGRDYHFTTQEKFGEMASAGKFLECSEVHGNLYGTPISEVLGRPRVICEVDVQGARKIKSKLPRARTIFILPPSLEELKRRIIERGREKSAEEMTLRLSNASVEMNCASEFEFWVENSDLDRTARQIQALIAHLSLGGGGRLRSYQDRGILDRVRSTFATP